MSSIVPSIKPLRSCLVSAEHKSTSSTASKKTVRFSGLETRVFQSDPTEHKDIAKLIQMRTKDLERNIKTMKFGIGIDSKTIQGLVSFSEKQFDLIFQGNEEIEVEFEILNETWRKAADLCSKTFSERIQTRIEKLKAFEQGIKNRHAFTTNRHLTFMSTLSPTDKNDLKDPQNLKLWNNYQSKLRWARFSNACHSPYQLFIKKPMKQFHKIPPETKISYLLAGLIGFAAAVVVRDVEGYFFPK